MSKCLTVQDFSSEVTFRLKNFGRMQEALVRELLEAKHLGICKMSTSENGKPVFKSLDSMLKSGNVTMKIDIILTNTGTRET